MSQVEQTINRGEAPPIKNIDNITFSGTEKMKLDNGAELFYINEGEQDIIKIEIYLHAGQTNEIKNLTANFTARLLKEGTSSKSSLQIAEEIDYYGANLTAKANQDFTVISILTLNKYLDKMLELCKDILENASFPNKEFQTVIRNSRQKYSINKEKTDFLASLKFREVMFGADHKYGYAVTDEGLADLSTEDLIKFYKDNYDLGSSKIFVSGKVGPSQLEQINTHLGKLTGSGSKREGVKAIIQNENYREEVIRKEKALQAAIRLGRFLPGKDHPDYNGLIILNTVLGGYFGSRLMSNIREDKGFTYGIYSIIHPFLAKNHMMIRTEVGVKQADDALKEIWNELNRLKTEEITAGELKLVKNYMMGNLLNESNGPFNKINTAKRLYLYGLDNEAFATYIHTIKTIDATSLKDLAIKYYNKDAFTLVIAKD